MSLKKGWSRAETPSRKEQTKRCWDEFSFGDGLNPDGLDDKDGGQISEDSGQGGKQGHKGTRYSNE